MTLKLLLLILMCELTYCASLVHKELYATDGDTFHLECNAKDGFDIYLQNNAETLSIGGCSLFGICYLMKASLKDQYSLGATDTGGLLTLHNIGNDHYGNYTCTGTFDNTKSVSYAVLRRHNMVKNGCGADGTIFSVLTVHGYLIWTCGMQRIYMMSSLISYT